MKITLLQRIIIFIFSIFFSILVHLFIFYIVLFFFNIFVCDGFLFFDFNFDFYPILILDLILIIIFLIGFSSFILLRLPQSIYLIKFCLLAFFLFFLFFYLKGFIINCFNSNIYSGSLLFDYMLDFYEMLTFYLILIVTFLIGFGFFTFLSFSQLINFIHIFLIIIRFFSCLLFLLIQGKIYDTDALRICFHKFTNISFSSLSFNFNSLFLVLRSICRSQHLDGSTLFYFKFISGNSYCRFIKSILITLIFSSIIIPSLFMLYALDPSHSATIAAAVGADPLIFNTTAGIVDFFKLRSFGLSPAVTNELLLFLINNPSIIIPRTPGIFVNNSTFIPISDFGMAPMAFFSKLSLENQSAFVGVFKIYGLLSEESASVLQSYLDSGIRVDSELNYAYMYYISTNRHFLNGFPSVMRAASSVNSVQAMVVAVEVAKAMAAQAVPVDNAAEIAAGAEIMAREASSGTETVLNLIAKPEETDTFLDIGRTYHPLQSHGEARRIGACVSNKILKTIFPFIDIAIASGSNLSSTIVVVLSPIVSDNIALPSAISVVDEIALDLDCFTKILNDQVAPVLASTNVPTVAKVTHVSVVDNHTMQSIAYNMTHKMDSRIITTGLNNYAVTICPLREGEYSDDWLADTITEEIMSRVKPLVDGLISVGLSPAIHVVNAPIIAIPI